MQGKMIRKILGTIGVGILILCILCLSAPMLYAGLYTGSTGPYFNQYAGLEQLTPSFIKLPNGKLEYYQMGQGSPIVLIAGYATNVSSWNRNFLLTLAKSHQVIVFNNRGVDGSIINIKNINKNMSYTTQDLANDTDQLIKQLHLNKPAIVGISMGGMIAQQLAISYPNDISKLILINTAIAGSSAVPPNHRVEEVILHTPEGKLQRFILGMQLLAPPKWRIQMALSLMRERFQPANHAELFGVSQATLIKQQNLVIAWSKNNLAGQQIAHIQIPTLILSGGDDAVIPPMNSDILENTIPNAKLYRWMDGGHAMIYQYPVDIANAINYFIASN